MHGLLAANADSAFVMPVPGPPQVAAAAQLHARIPQLLPTSGFACDCAAHEPGAVRPPQTARDQPGSLIPDRQQTQKLDYQTSAGSPVRNSHRQVLPTTLAWTVVATSSRRQSTSSTIFPPVSSSETDHLRDAVVQPELRPENIFPTRTENKEAIDVREAAQSRRSVPKRVSSAKFQRSSPHGGYTTGDALSSWAGELIDLWDRK